MDNKIKIGQFIELDNGCEYCVVSSTMYKGDNFVFLINSSNYNEQYYAMVSNEENGINIIDNDASENEELISKLSEMFKNEIEKFILDMGKDNYYEERN